MASKSKAVVDEDLIEISSVTIKRPDGDAYEIKVERSAESEDWVISQGEDADKVSVYLPDDAAIDAFIEGAQQLRVLQKKGKK